MTISLGQLSLLLDTSWQNTFLQQGDAAAALEAVEPSLKDGVSQEWPSEARNCSNFMPMPRRPRMRPAESDKFTASLGCRVTICFTPFSVKK